MGDGAILNKGLILCTDSFTIEEVVRLMNVLKIKYNIDSRIHGIKTKEAPRPRIYIIPNSMPIVINLIKPYLVPSMMYKLNIK